MKLFEFTNAIGDINDTYLIISEKQMQKKTKKVSHYNVFRKGFKISLACIIMFFFLFITTSALGLFSPLNGDDFSLKAEYKGNGIVDIHVTNQSNKTLTFEKQLKLIQWSNNKEVEQISNDVTFHNITFEPHTSGIMTIDISKMYNLELLEKDIGNHDHYYFILTNHNFIFGHDWHCTIDFVLEKSISNENLKYVKKIELNHNENSQLNRNYEILEELKPFFNDYVIDSKMKNEKIYNYYKKVEEILSQEKKNGKNIVSSVNPFLFVGKPKDQVIFDRRVSNDLQYQLIGEHHYVLDAYHIPVGATQYEDCMVLSTYIPQKESEINDTGGAELPLVYIFQYELEQLKKKNSYVFIRGRLLNYEDLEPFKIYQDDKYVSYDVTDLFYTDLNEHIDIMTSYRNDIYMDEGVNIRIKTIYDYLRNKEKINHLFYYHR